MKAVEARQICICGEKSVGEAVSIFKDTTLPYKKAKKLVTGCNKSCCRRPLMALFKMVEFGEIDYEEIDILIDQFESRFEDELNG
jgi:DNA-directed RNA polymerase subunit N (RpoN/RPB10)